MRCLVYSDIHLEFGDFEPPLMDVEAVFIAGDLHIGDDGIQWIKRHFTKTRVFYIPGNHEYYQNEFYDVQRRIKAAEDEYLTILLNESVDFLGWRICGGTMWTDFALMGDDKQFEAMRSAGNRMNDYRKVYIENNEKLRKLQPEDTQAIYFRTMEFLKNELSEKDNRHTIVMTHHVPIPVPRRRRDILDPAYAVNLTDKIEAWQPALWISGHTHTSMDTKIGQTRLLSNPRGYVPFAANEHFNPSLILEL